MSYTPQQCDISNQEFAYQASFNAWRLFLALFWLTALALSSRLIVYFIIQKSKEDSSFFSKIHFFAWYSQVAITAAHERMVCAENYSIDSLLRHNYTRIPVQGNYNHQGHLSRQRCYALGPKLTTCSLHILQFFRGRSSHLICQDGLWPRVLSGSRLGSIWNQGCSSVAFRVWREEFPDKQFQIQKGHNFSALQKCLPRILGL